MTSLEACALCLNGSFVCVEVKANNSPETTEGGTLWNLSDKNVALSSRTIQRIWGFFCQPPSLLSLCIPLPWAAAVTVCHQHANNTVWLCGGELHVPVSPVIFNWVITLRDTHRGKEEETMQGEQASHHYCECRSEYFFLLFFWLMLYSLCSLCTSTANSWKCKTRILQLSRENVISVQQKRKWVFPLHPVNIYQQTSVVRGKIPASK